MLIAVNVAVYVGALRPSKAPIESANRKRQSKVRDGNAMPTKPRKNRRREDVDDAADSVGVRWRQGARGKDEEEEIDTPRSDSGALA
jgi:hypothetical protein